MVDLGGSLYDIGQPSSAFAGTNLGGSLHELTSTAPPAAPGVPTIPAVTLVSPGSGATLAPSTAIVVDVTDPDGFTRILLVVHISPPSGSAFLVHDGDNFRAGFEDLSTRTAIANGFRFSIRKNSGWDAATNVEVYSFDTEGNEGA